MHDLALRPPGLPAWNILSFCAGVGGLELGIRIAEPGARCVVHVEREAAAAASLVASMEAGWFHPAPVWSDAGSFDARPWRGVVHCVASGDPCQPNSVAGRGLGNADERWLIDQLLRVVGECGPDRVFRENVTGNADGQLAALVPALEGMGYRVKVGIFSSTAAQGSHGRERLVLMADRADSPRWLHEGPWRPFEGAPDARGCGGELVHAGRSERGQELGPASGEGSRAEDPDRSHEPSTDLGVADAARRPQTGSRSALHAGSQSLAGGGELHGQRGWAGSGDGGEGMAHTRCARLSLAEQPGQPGQPGSAERGFGSRSTATEFRGACIPPTAPGPSDPAWSIIAAEHPELLPAFSRYDRFVLALRDAGFAPDGNPLKGGRAGAGAEAPDLSGLDAQGGLRAIRAAVFQAAAQSHLRGMADADAVRTERLRAAGNGVDPLVGADAWVSLGAAHALDRAAARAAAVKAA